MKGLQKLCIILPGLLIAAGAGSCNLDMTDNANRRVVLGDSATIVTEHDSQYLEDAFIDLEDANLEKDLSGSEDSFNNVAKAQQLAKQQQQDSIARVKAAEDKKKDADSEAKKKEEQRKQEEKNKKKNVKNKQQTASQKKKAEEEKKKKRR